MKDLVSNQIVRYLEARDVEHIFGLCGHTNIALLAALEKSDSISFVNVRHEQIAAHAADGVLEAMESPGERFRLAVQWHPETRTDHQLFDALVAAAGAR